MRRASRATLCVAALLLCLGGRLQAADPAPKAAPARKAPAAKKSAAAKLRSAPAFTLKDLDGKNVSLADFKGKVVLLNFWATWCGPCKIEIPWFIDFEQRYKNQGFVVLGVAMDDPEDREQIKPYVAKNKINYRILLGDDNIAEPYGGVESLPTTFVIDRAGIIRGTHIGLVSKGDYEKEIVALLGK